MKKNTPQNHALIILFPLSIDSFKVIDEKSETRFCFKPLGNH